MSRKNLLSPSVQTPTQSCPAASSVTQPPAQRPWEGHHRATRKALAGILERTRRGDGVASLNERVLANVCELRRALASGEWREDLGTNCVPKLVATRFALNEIGAMNVAAYVSETIAAWRRSSSVQYRQSLLVKLEQELNAAGPTLDALLDKFARDLLDASRATMPSAASQTCTT
jgi:hypothetical protein